jgi:hypothetical protein
MFCVLILPIPSDGGGAGMSMSDNPSGPETEGDTKSVRGITASSSITVLR